MVQTFQAVFWDQDGSLAGHANSFVFPYYNCNAHEPRCSRLDINVYDDSMLRVNTTVHRLEIDFVKPNSLDFTDIRIYGEGGQSDEIYFLPPRIYMGGVHLWLPIAHIVSSVQILEHLPPSFVFVGAWRNTSRVYNKTGRHEAIGIKFSPYPYDYNPSIHTTTGIGMAHLSAIWHEKQFHACHGW